MNDRLQQTGGEVRLYVESALRADIRIAAAEGQAHYLLHVMRARVGRRIRLFNGRDGEWLAGIAEVGKHRCIFECLNRIRAQSASPDIWLCFAPIKKTPADYLAQKATELGVAVLQPVITRRTVVTRVNTERLRANAIEAAEQSDRLTVPEVREPVALHSLLAGWPTERLLIFCDEAGDGLPLAQALRKSNSKSWTVLTGPEGGFDPVERDAIRAHPSVVPVSLGPRILRADTAALGALSVFQAIAGDWS
ncbi:MAG: 16S rRNA (uracil(1498)-N(3))-methyltransferase [Alphaproteobacteria bacterium]|nr:16S rRNA (uracil(1498)-N(3))-methyltransferase [Alphaproteobacteria bacterium]